MIAALTLSLVLASPAADSVRSYAAARTRVPVGVDGDLDEPAWALAAWSDHFVDIRGASHPAPRLRTRVKMLWDDRSLYIAAQMEEPHLWGTLTDRDAIIYHDHDFEVFLDPDGDGRAYYELEINALGTEFDLFLDRPYTRGGRAYIGWDMPGLATAVRLQGTVNDPTDTDAGWTVEIAIPWADLHAPGSPAASPPSVGTEWRVNFSRVQWPLEVTESGYRRAADPSPTDPHPEDNWVWSPQGEIDMHLPERWGVVRFVDTSGAGLSPTGARAGMRVR